MKHLILASLLILSSAVIIPASAETMKASPIAVENAWLRATPKGAPVIGGYATIKNEGATPDRIVGAEIPMAAKAEVHTMSMKNGVMHMQRLDEGLPLAAGASVTLSPGGYHLMFLKPSEQVKEGQTIKGTILFEKAGAVPVTFAVGGMAAKSAPGGAATTDMPGMNMGKH